MRPLPSVRYVVGVSGCMALALGLAWIYVFGFTDYRAHLRSVGLGLGILTTLAGLWMLLAATVRPRS